MTMHILVPIHTYPNGTSVEFTGHVAAVARHLDAGVHALVLDADFPQAASALGNMLIDVPTLIGGAKEKCREHGVAVAQALEAEMGTAGNRIRTTHLEGFTGTMAGVVSNLARYHDLVLMSIGADDVTTQATAEAVIFGSGKPTLLVPEASPIAAFDHVMIAWDGSRVAARAVSDARDFLERAQAVTIVLVIDEKALPDDNPGQGAGRVSCAARDHDDRGSGSGKGSSRRRNPAGPCERDWSRADRNGRFRALPHSGFRVGRRDGRRSEGSAASGPSVPLADACRGAFRGSEMLGYEP